MKLYIICGHGAGDSGACAYGVEEQERVRALGWTIKGLGGDNVVLLDTVRNWYADAGINRLDLPADAQLVELHMDSAQGARGGHVIYYGGFDPDAYDVALANFIAGMFPGRANILVGRTDLANPNRAAARGFNYRLIENGFISSYEDLCTFNANLTELAKGYLDVFGIPYDDDQNETTPVVPDVGPTPTLEQLDVDGYWGMDTTKALQRYFGIEETGFVDSQNAEYMESNPGLVGGWDWVVNPIGCQLIVKLQEKFGADADGIIGPATIGAMQKCMGTTVDGEIWEESAVVKAIQKALNNGSF